MKTSPKIKKIGRRKDSKTPLWQNTLVFLASFVITLLVVEIILTLFISVPHYGVQPGLHTAHPEVEYLFSANYSGTHITNDFSYTIQTNSIGINDDELNSKQAENIIIFIGDSVTEGYGVNQSLAYPQQVSALLGAEYDTINGGVRGYGTKESRKMYAFLDDNVKADTVIYTFVYNDLADNLNNKTIYRGLSVGGRSRSTVDVFLIARHLQLFRLLYYEIYFNNRQLDYNAISTERASMADNEVIITVFENEITAMQQEASKRNDTLIVVLQPWLKAIQVRKPNATTGDLVIHETVKGVLERHNITYIDLEDELRKELETKDLYFSRQDGHYTEYGNRWLASEVSTWLRTNQY